jgi:iron complex outermembrane receptor protein
MAIRPTASSADSGGDEAEDASPRHQVVLSSTNSLPGRLMLSTFFRWVARLPSQNVPSYAELDLHLRWRATERLDLALTGANLLHERHLEFGSGTIGGGDREQPIRRSLRVEAAVRW